MKYDLAESDKPLAFKLLEAELGKDCDKIAKRDLFEFNTTLKRLELAFARALVADIKASASREILAGADSPLRKLLESDASNVTSLGELHNRRQ